MQNDSNRNWRKVDLSDHASDMLAILLEDFNQGREHKLSESQMLALILADAVRVRFQGVGRVVHALQKRN
jgi:hypothetical protein